MNFAWMFRAIVYVLFLKPFVFLLIGVAVKGREHLRGGRPFILLSNHNSHMDTLVLLSLMPLRDLRWVRPVAAADYFCASRATGFFVSLLFNILPIQRKPVPGADSPIEVMASALQAGQSLILYPEGTRGKPEEMSRFHSGAARLMERFPDVPVLPVYLDGMGRILPKGEPIPVPFIGRVNIGAPRIYRGSPTEITVKLEQDIQELKRECRGE